MKNGIRLASSCALLLMIMATTTRADFSGFDTAQYIISGSGTRVNATGSGSGYPVIYSSHPEYASGSGKLLSYSLTSTRFRHYMYHVNDSGSSRYIGFAIKNEATASANLYVNMRGYAVGTDSNPALVGRDAQYKWYNTPNADSAGCGGCDVYIASIPAGGWWYSTDPVTGGGAPPSVRADFLTSMVSGSRGLHEGIYDFALVNNTTGGAVPAKIVSFIHTSSKPANPDTLASAAGSGGSNAYCPSSKLTFNVTIDFNNINGASRYFDIFNNNTGENICAIIIGSPTSYGNYGVDYELRLSFINTGGYKVHWTATARNGEYSQYFAGTLIQDASRYTGKTSAILHDYNDQGTDQGRLLATQMGSTNRINTQLTGGNVNPLRLYFYTWH